MKLIDILVQELPKHGGWPDGINFVAQDSATAYHAGYVYGYEKAPIQWDDYWSDSESDDAYGEILFKSEIISDDSRYSMVTRKEYEAASGTLQKVVWDGIDIPPVGSLVKGLPRDAASFEKPFIFSVDCIHDGCFIGVTMAGERVYGEFKRWEMSPFQTEEERKQEETVNTLAEIISGHMTTEDLALAKQIYEAIAQGKVEGLKLSD